MVNGIGTDLAYDILKEGIDERSGGWLSNPMQFHSATRRRNWINDGNKQE